VTPNKKAFSGDLAHYQAIMEAARASGSRCFYETTVGAALPVIQTVQDFRETGDRVRSVSGIFSGTLAYLFNLYDGSKPFSALLADALEQGFTEPDPRDDLSGMDVARKLVIVARELGHKVGLDDVNVESLVPAGLTDVSVAEFMAGIHGIDDEMLGRLRAAEDNGAVLRYIGTLSEDGALRVALTEVPRTSAFANLALTDNLVQIQSDRYSDNPLVIQGPGAGPAVTAGGVFADLLRLSAQLGNRR
ncbi:MAG: bifunctional aspartate kinase/homoserine dehydrogenase I, partial [Pseudomonadota bacterium]